MPGSEWAQWFALYELESEERKAAMDRASGQQSARPIRSRTFSHRGRRR